MIEIERKHSLSQTIGKAASSEDLRVQKLKPIMRQLGAEGIVMLENNGVLPLKKGAKISIFGRVAVNYMYTGYGSGGDVRYKDEVNLISALSDCGVVDINTDLAEKYNEFVNSEKGQIHDAEWGEWPRFYEEMPLDDEIVQKARKQSDIAVVVIGRAAGEERENVLEKGGYFLRDEELNMIDKVTRFFDDIVIVINSGNIIDMEWTLKYNGKISALMLVWQGGQESGNQIADIITGKISPSGKLTDTIAKTYEDYPSWPNFGLLEECEYYEDIFVGYRYFETFAKDKVLYPFGHGLSYTTFCIAPQAFECNGTKINCSVKITNTGNFSGKETVQLYVSKPNDVMSQPSVELVAFCKTKLLKQGESEIVNFSVKGYEISSFDDTGVSGFEQSYVLLSGKYSFFVGNSVRNIVMIGSFDREKPKRLYSLKPLLGLQKPLKRLSNIKNIRQDEIVKVIKNDLKYRILKDIPQPYTKKNIANASLKQVLNKEIGMADFISNLSDIELEELTRGEGAMNSDLGTEGNAGVFGGISQSLQNKGVPAITTSDGPSGIRLSRHCSLLPCATQLACSFNADLVAEMFAYVGEELSNYGVDVMLAPGMNIHRNPLGGRNFEYYSEDPIVSGKIAKATVIGIQTKAFSACPKHFAANSQETNRDNNNSIVSQRALREIYLKGFEICIKEADVKCLMVSYNKINGVWSHYNYDLAKEILRGEWGYTGVIITDWWMQPSKSPEFPNLRDNAYRVRSCVDVLMPGGLCLEDRSLKSDGTLLETLGKQNGITRAEIERCAENVLDLCVKKFK